MTATWSQKLQELLKEHQDVLVSICITHKDENIFVPIDHSEFCREFDDDYGWPNGTPFTAWGEKYVYFPVVYDGAEWIRWVPRNPILHTAEHVGGY